MLHSHRKQEGREMGIEWMPMLVRSDAPLDRVEQLIEQQATLFLATYLNYNHLKEIRDDDLKYAEDLSYREVILEQQYRTCCQELESFLILDGSDYVRVYGITSNALFPPEWRIEAYRSFLSADLRKQLDQWQSYVDAVQQGGYQAYLFELYLYRLSLRLHRAWCQVHQMGEKVLVDFPSSHASELFQLSEQIEQAAPPVLTGPRWADWQQKADQPFHQNDRRYRSLHEWGTRLHAFREQLHAWKRFSLPPFPSFEEFLHEALQEERLHALRWLETVCERRMGVYLDY